MNATQETCRTDEELLAAFEDTTLPFDEWNHRAHVRVAFIFLSKHSFDESIDRIRRGIQRYNHAHAVPSTPTRGYHETVTIAFITLVASSLAQCPEVGDSTDFLARHPGLLSKRALEKYYSKELLFSASARKAFLAPDLQPLPFVFPAAYRLDDRQKSSVDSFRKAESANDDAGDLPLGRF